jgi:hypothetical protein
MTGEERFVVENIYLYLIIFLLSGVFFSVVGIISNVRLFVFVGEVFIAGGAFAIIVNKILSRYTIYTFGRQLGVEPKETLLAAISRVVTKQKFKILKRDVQWQLIGSQESSLWSVKREDTIDIQIGEENMDGIVLERAATTEVDIPLPATLRVIDLINDTISKPIQKDIPEFSWPGHKRYKIEYSFKAESPYRIEQYIEYPPCNDPSKDDFIDTAVFSDTMFTKLSITFQGINPNDFFFEAYVIDEMYTKYKNLKVTLSGNQVKVAELGHEDLIGFTRKGDQIFFWHKPLSRT